MGQSAAIASRDIEYATSSTTLRGFFACESANAQPRPAIAVVHEWWGVNDYIRERVNMLAGLGYAAMALDIYGNGKVAADAQEAGTMMNATLGDVAQFEARLEAGLETLAAQPEVDSNRIGAMGYCLGGASVLHAARMGLKLSGVVSFHGALGAMRTADPAAHKPRVLVCHGAADKLVPDDDVSAFKEEMATGGFDLEFVAYEGALHGFTSREADANGKKYGLPLGYHEDADRRSWEAMQAFFKKAL